MERIEQKKFVRDKEKNYCCCVYEDGQRVIVQEMNLFSIQLQLR